MTQDQTSSILPGRDAGTVARTRTDNGEESLLVAYRNLQAPGAPTPWFGDDDGPFEWPQGAMTVDGTTGITPQTVPGKPQKLAVDPWGRLWVRAQETPPVPPFVSSTTSATGESHHDVAPAIAPAVRVVLEVGAYNNTGGPLYLMLFNAAALPANGTVPTIMAIKVCPDSTVSLDLEDSGLEFANGIIAALSITPMSLTIAGATAGSFTITYR